MAIRMNLLIDVPDKSRKFHSRPTPLTGGLGIILGILAGVLSFLLLGNYSLTNKQNDLAYQTSIEVISDEDKKEVFDINLKLDSKNNSYSNLKIDGEEVNLPNFDVSNLDNGIFEVKFGENQSLRFIINDEKILSIDTGESFEFQDQSKSDHLKIDIFLQGLALACIALLLLSMFDDLSKKGINPVFRLLMQFIITLMLIIYSDAAIKDLGFSFLGWDGSLDLLAIPFTAFAVIGITNAFNMVDGINGLCSSLAASCIGALFFISFPLSIGYLFIIILASIIGFLLYNLGVFGRQRGVFLGDNGSIFLGFLAAWFCVYFASPSINILKPVTALWLVAIPLIDCVSIILYRISIGSRPFEADRNHLHHLIYDKLIFVSNKSKRESFTLLIIFFLSIMFASIGIFLESFVSSNTSLLAIIATGLIFHIFGRRLINS